MGDVKEERALRALGAALDEHAPVIRHGRREFPEGTPFLWMSFPGSGEATVFLDGRQWICLGEPGGGRAPTQLAAGQVDDDPALVAERLVSALISARRRPSAPVRALRASGIGLAAGVGVCLLSMIIMAILVGGNGYLTDTTISAVHVLAAVLGGGAGLWAGVRWWRRG
ncbi:hypothetical protein FHR32_006189 [Streptosporangium album]|uniref:Uncharacterized protein n=1 Tax=Streptosporangium album TaxID=47479 RepID=A0A7W7WCF8_9ACTN|nr:hypothetical protein [Streptosporangium album]MBB4941803.1 hypothetical protein [Streptosporangium album]